MDEKIQKLMDTLQISEEEARQVLDDDKRIDRGEKLFELPDELKAGAKKARMADHKEHAPAKRERKADEDKRRLIAIIAESLEQLEIIPTVTNEEREMEMVYNGRKFKLVLSAPRS